jgi:hypothetical protein
MSEGTDAVAMAKYWHGKWKDALKHKQFERAEEYFRTANRWKQRADIHGMMGQDFNEERESK